MKRISLFFLFILGLSCSSLFSQPSLYVQRIKNLGRLKEGKVYPFYIEIENRGDKILEIKGIRYSCGCIHYEGPSKISILPSQKIRLKFSFDTTGYFKDTKKFIYLFTNDPHSRYVKIEVISYVEPKTANFLSRFENYTLPIIILAGLVDGINPCAFTVIVFFVVFLQSIGFKSKILIAVGLSFILGVFITYVLLGLGLFEFIYLLNIYHVFYLTFYIFVGILALTLGLFNLYDAVVIKITGNPYNIKNKLPSKIRTKIHKIITLSLKNKNRSMLTLTVISFLVGFWVSLLESVCTGQVYLPTLSYIIKVSSTYKLLAFCYLLLYNIAFILPLFAVFLLGLWGVKSEEFSAFFRRHVLGIKLLLSFIFITLGVILLHYKK